MFSMLDIWILREYSLSMSIKRENNSLFEETDSVDSYFECISACSLGDDGVDCVTKCVEVHLKSDIDWDLTGYKLFKI